MTQKVYFKAQNVLSSSIQSGIKDRIILTTNYSFIQKQTRKMEIGDVSDPVLTVYFPLVVSSLLTLYTHPIHITPPPPFSKIDYKHIYQICFPTAATGGFHSPPGPRTIPSG